MKLSEILLTGDYNPHDKGTNCKYLKLLSIAALTGAFKYSSGESSGSPWEDFYKTIPGDVEAVSVPQFGALLCARVELLFCLLKEKAERGIRTYETEGELRSCKDVLKLLAAHPGGVVIPGSPLPITPDTFLRVLVHLPPDCKHTICGLPAYPFHLELFVNKHYTDYYFSILEILVPKEIPRMDIRLASSGELICLHQDNLPPVALKLLKI